MLSLFKYQKEAIDKLRSGSILCGGVGSGKSLTSLAYFFVKEGLGSIDPFAPMSVNKPLYIITTARKRDTKEWEDEYKKLIFPKNHILIIDSWNNIAKYSEVENAFFIFDEQRLVGSGAWVKSFLKIAKRNNWILLSATPGDTWLDYIPVFVANGFYKNRTAFLRQHVIFSNYVKYPKIERYIETHKLTALKDQILVKMAYTNKTVLNHMIVPVVYDKSLYDYVGSNRWNIFEDKPIQNIVELCYIWRKIINLDPSRVEAVRNLILKTPKSIIFYNFNYELNILRELCSDINVPYSEWNGQKHEDIPLTKKWVYLVQYTAGAEGWNCTETDTVIFYSQNYSYKVMHQAAGRIDRLNTPFNSLYYYHIKSAAPIDLAISRALQNKKKFNEKTFFKKVFA